MILGIIDLIKNSQQDYPSLFFFQRLKYILWISISILTIFLKCIYVNNNLYLKWFKSIPWIQLESI